MEVLFSPNYNTRTNLLVYYTRAEGKNQFNFLHKLQNQIFQPPKLFKLLKSRPCSGLKWFQIPFSFFKLKKLIKTW